MNHRIAVTSRLFLSFAAVGMLASACGGSDSSDSADSGDKAAFCAANAKLDQASAGATSGADVIAVLKANQPTLDEFKKTAPAEIKADADKVSIASAAVISSNDPSSFATPDVEAASKRIDVYCGKSPASSTP